MEGGRERKDRQKVRLMERDSETERKSDRATEKSDSETARQRDSETARQKQVDMGGLRQAVSAVCFTEAKASVAQILVAQVRTRTARTRTREKNDIATITAAPHR
eukprot:359426-Rhodomonas_salina.1